MSDQENIYNRHPIGCPDCLTGEAYETNWAPGRGMDQAMRQFRCRRCQREFYRSPPIPRTRTHSQELGDMEPASAPET